ncbi:MAG TPA: hydroxylamine reductase, partial [Rectinema sp.]|nr:hydroxylamine reductase [Rectinema sp.]
MFCNQCQETLRNSGCNIAKGMCGKTSETAHLQDLLLYVCKGIGYWADKARAVGYFPEEDAFFVTRMLFATITNANFAPSDFEHWIVEALKRRDRIRQEFSERGGKIDAMVPDAATWNAVDLVAIRMAAAQDKGGLLEITDEDVRALKALVLYGLKGMAAYLEHAYVLGVSSKEVFEFMFSALAKLADDTIDKEALIQLVLDTGKYGVEAMALLDKANTGSYGSPRITKVSTGVRNRPGILISGHDLRDLHDLLEQTKGTGIDVYTHGEMLPAHYYPFFEKYDNLYGNYGNAWWKQDSEIEKFHGPVLFTSNCLVPPKESYKNRIFTTGVVGFEGVTHIPDREPGKMKDFSAIIEMAKTCSPPEALEDGEIVGGFAHDQVFALADKVVEAVKNGAIKRFIVMAGCDGRQPKRSYYTEVAQKLP